MSAIYFLIPIAVGLVGFAIWLFFWAVDSGQYDDLEGPGYRILMDRDDCKGRKEKTSGVPVKRRGGDETED